VSQSKNMPPSNSLSHGVLISYDDIGVLITGTSGIGKSDSALELLHMGAKLVCDDAPQFKLENGRIIGSCQEKFLGIMHIRGLGFIHIPSLLDKQTIQTEVELKLIIELVSEQANSTATSNSLLNLEYARVFYQDKAISHLSIEKSHFRPMGLLLSTAIKQFKLKINNNDPCQALIKGNV